MIQPIDGLRGQTVRSTLSRRQFGMLATLSAAAGGATLGGCQIVTSSSEPTTSSSGAGSGAVIEIPDTGATLPTNDVEIRFLYNGPGPNTALFEAWLPAYHKAHPNLTVTPTELPNAKINEVLPLQLRNGKAPDVFVDAGGLTQFVAAGQIATLDDIIPDFATWKKGFPFGILVEGDNQFNGKTYAVPAASNRRTGTLLIYNTDYLKQAGYDPSATPMTWDDFRKAAKDTTKQGDGKYYGFLYGATPPGPLGNIVLDLGQLAGASGGGMDWKTGQYNYSADEMVAAAELLLAIQSDGSMFPGAASLTDQQARARMPQGDAAMMLQGAWNYPVWKQSNPGFNYGVARQPTPTGDVVAPISYAAGGAAQFSVYAQAPEDHKVVAGDLVSYLGTVNGQAAYATYIGAAAPAWSEDAIKAIRDSPKVDKHDIETFSIYDEIMRLAPSPLIRNPQIAQVQLALKPVHPDLGEVVQGLLTGQLKDAKQALQNLDQQSEKALDDAIAAVTKKGSTVSRDDWKFPTWDPQKDFTEQDY